MARPVDCQVKDILCRQADFDRVYATGRRFRRPLMTAVVAPGNQQSIRVAFVISRKVSRLAVVRNRLRRRMREIWRGLRPRLTGQHDIVLITRPVAVAATYAELQTTVERLMQSAGVLQNASLETAD